MFKNEPLIDFSIAGSRESFADALASVEEAATKGEFHCSPVVGGKKLAGAKPLDLFSPSDPTLKIGTVSYATASDADMALDILVDSKSAWKHTPVKIRSEILRSIASEMRKKRNFLAALMILEEAKPWDQADADVVEAIDFCDYYASEMERLAGKKVTQEISGEQNYFFYQPRGIGVIISPWNFPLAIPCGMTVATLVTGNAAILKPAEQASLISAEFTKIALAAGVPPTTFALLPGTGEEVGSYLVEDPRVNIICFTGSKSVGLEINRRAAQTPDGQSFVKKVIAEMGGKNAIIVYEDADLDEAVKGVLYSVFGFSGQKCSACSRVITVGSVTEPFLTRLSRAAADVQIGDSRKPETVIGPLLDKEAQERVLSVLDNAYKEHKLAFRGEQPANGYFVPAAIFRDVDSYSKLWREEIFAPVLACTSVDTFEEALNLANGVPYALTGGIYSRSPANIEETIKRFEVGNLYINRHITGAIVGRQPFGGFKLSGVGSKAGGCDYLLQFMQPRSVSENTMRRGFTPELAN